MVDTTGETTITISREVLLQVQKDGVTYKTLAKQMATIILNNMMNDPFSGGEDIDLILFGDLSDMKVDSRRELARRWYKEFGIPVLAEASDGQTLTDSEGYEVRVTHYRVWPKGE